MIASGAAPLLEPPTRKDFERIIDAGPAMPDDLSQRATQVDRHWGSKLDAVDENPDSIRSTRGLYRYIFRRDSQHTHNAVASLEPLVLGSPPGPFQVIGAETDPGIHNPFTMAPVIYGLALIFAEPMLGISGLRRAADDVFARTSSPPPADAPAEA